MLFYLFIYFFTYNSTPTAYQNNIRIKIKCISRVCLYRNTSGNTFSSLRIVLMDDALDCLMSFADFLFAFQLQFYYQGTGKNDLSYTIN